MKRSKKKYAKLNHLQITVRDAVRSRHWYVENIGLKVEFEVPQQGCKGRGIGIRDLFRG